MSAVYDEIIDFIAHGTTSESVADFEPSQEAKDYVFNLIRREKDEGLTADESAELGHFMQIEHIMRMAKARAKALCVP